MDNYNPMLEVIVISKEKVIERRLGKRISRKLNLTIRLHTSGREIQNAAIENIGIGGMQFSIPADYRKLGIHDICSFIFDLPHLGKCYVLGEIRYCRDFIDSSQHRVVHYGVKFIKLSMTTWSHIKKSCQAETALQEKFAPEAQPDTIARTLPENETLTAKTFMLIDAQIRTENGLILAGKVMDINYGGLQLQLYSPVPVEENLDITIAFADLVFRAKGICRWCDNSSEDASIFLANVGFEDIPQEQFENLKSLMIRLATHMADLIAGSHFQDKSF